MHAIAQPPAILVRMLAVALLVSGTYNPSGYSYYHWAFHGVADHWASKTVVGQLIVVGFVFCAQATIRSLGLLLSIPLLLVIATGVWLQRVATHPDPGARDRPVAGHRRQFLVDPLSPEWSA